MVKIHHSLASTLRLIHLPHDQIAFVAAVLNRFVGLQNDAVLHVAVA